MFDTLTVAEMHDLMNLMKYFEGRSVLGYSYFRGKYYKDIVARDTKVTQKKIIEDWKVTPRPTLYYLVVCPKEQPDNFMVKLCLTQKEHSALRFKYNVQYIIPYKVEAEGEARRLARISNGKYIKDALRYN